MKAHLVRYLPPGAVNDGTSDLAEISIDGTTLLVEAFFGSDREPEGAALDVEIQPDFTGIDESWEQIFGGNPQGQVSLVSLGGTSYRVGRIASINPLVAHCGLVSLRVPLASNDTRVVGEFVAFSISALAAY